MPASLPATPSADSWPDEILAAAKEFFTGSISVVKPGAPGTWNAQSGAITGGTTGTTVLTQRPARIQQLGMPQQSANGDSYTVRRRFRIQCEILAGDGVLREGLVVVIHNGGRDTSLTLYRPRIVSAVNSSQAALRTIEAIAETPGPP